MPQETQRLALLKLLEQNPNLTQRELNQAMGVSLGKTNYCLKASIEKGFVKFGRFCQNKDKYVYAYLLTPFWCQKTPHCSYFYSTQGSGI